MNWSHVVASFVAGMFLANAVPHFVYGVCGDRFPTPFAKPSGRGLSSPVVNTAWALLNGLVGAWLFRVSGLARGGHVELAAFVAGIAAISLMMSSHFAGKHAE